MQLKKGYRQTEIGVLPDDWGITSIGNTFRLNNGCAFRPEDWKDYGAPIIRIQNLNDPDAKFNYSQAPVAEKNRVDPGDLLFAWSGTIGTSFGARIWQGPTGVLNQHIFKVLMNEDKITLKFALLVFYRIQEDIGKQAHGFKTSFVHVKKSDLVKVKLPLPPIEEQRAIAGALSDVDALLGVLDRMITKKRDLKQAAMQQLLTGQTRLPGFKGDWEEVSVESVTSKVGSGITPRGGNANYLEQGRPFVRSQNVGWGPLRLDDLVFISEETHAGFAATELLPSDVLLNITGASIGRCSLVDERIAGGNVNQHVCLLRANVSRIAARFLQYVLLSQIGQDQINSFQAGGNREGLNFGQIRSLQIPLPPCAKEQTAIAEVLSDMDAELSALDRRREKTQALKQGMMQELLTGKTRLVTPAN